MKNDCFNYILCGWAMVVNVLILRIGAQLWTVLEDEWILESGCASHYVHAYNGAVRTYQNWVMKQVQSEFMYSIFQLMEDTCKSENCC